MFLVSGHHASHRRTLIGACLGLLALCAFGGAVPVCAAEGSITLYSGRGKSLVGPVIEKFQTSTGIEVRVKYGDSAEMAATILEEGRRSPADVFYSQDAGALGALATEDLLATLPAEVLDRVDARFRSPSGTWVGTSGRARVVAYNTDAVAVDDLPSSILGFTDPAWKGRIGWAPTNGSFQSFVTAMRVDLGEDAAEDWLRAIIANEPRVYPKNSAIVAALGDGEVDVGFVNHYYLFRFLSERGESFPVRNYYPTRGDVGALINVAGVGMLGTSRNSEAALQFIQFLLGAEAQQFFADETNEYPLIDGVHANPALKPLAEIDTPEIDLSDLSDLKGTLELLQKVGALE